MRRRSSGSSWSKRRGVAGRAAGWREWRDAVVCRLAETIAEQRTLWALRTRTAAALRYPGTIAVERARSSGREGVVPRAPASSRWFIIDLVLFVSSVVFFFIPGPNLVAYYFAFRFIGHLQSWRGARQAMDLIKWSFEPDAGTGGARVAGRICRARNGRRASPRLRRG